MTDAERHRIVLELDVKEAQKQFPIPLEAENMLAGLHKARYLLESMPTELRHASRQWLHDNNYNTWMGVPLPPVGEFFK